MHHLLQIWFDWVLHGGYLGIIVLMALESSIFPVPSEIVIPPAAFLAGQGKLNLWGVIAAGAFFSFGLAPDSFFFLNLAGGEPAAMLGPSFLLCLVNISRTPHITLALFVPGVFFCPLAACR